MLYKPAFDSQGEDNGQVTIIGGSHLFHGAPLYGVKIASRIVDMVFFGSPERSVGDVAERIKSKLLSFVWVPWDEVEHYIEKSDAVLIGPGFLRFKSEKVPHGLRQHICDEACQVTKNITETLLKKFPGPPRLGEAGKKWVIDAGSLQTITPDALPINCVITPNVREFEVLFKVKMQKSKFKITRQKAKIIQEKAKRYNCTIVLKGPETIVASKNQYEVIQGGNPGLTKGGTGDVQAGLTVALLAKNDPFVAAAVAAKVVKLAADALFKIKGVYYNADDLADKIPEVLKDY